VNEGWSYGQIARNLVTSALTRLPRSINNLSIDPMPISVDPVLPCGVFVRREAGSFISSFCRRLMVHKRKESASSQAGSETTTKSKNQANDGPESKQLHHMNKSPSHTSSDHKRDAVNPARSDEKDIIRHMVITEKQI
jgi:hypothetical protein